MRLFGSTARRPGVPPASSSEPPDIAMPMQMVWTSQRM